MVQISFVGLASWESAWVQQLRPVLTLMVALFVWMSRGRRQMHLAVGVQCLTLSCR